MPEYFMFSLDAYTQKRSPGLDFIFIVLLVPSLVFLLTNPLRVDFGEQNWSPKSQSRS